MQSKILVVDEDTDFVELLRFRLKSVSVDVVTSTTVHDTLSMIRESAVDLICLDADVPTGHGSQVVEHIAKHGKETSVPMIVFTENENLSTLSACNRIRAYYIHKSPTFWNRLKPVLGEFLDVPSVRNTS